MWQRIQEHPIGEYFQKDHHAARILKEDLQLHSLKIELNRGLESNDHDQRKTSLKWATEE